MLAQWFKGIRFARSLSPADGVTEPGINSGLDTGRDEDGSSEDLYKHLN